MDSGASFFDFIRTDFRKLLTGRVRDAEQELAFEDHVGHGHVKHVDIEEPVDTG